MRFQAYIASLLIGGTVALAGCGQAKSAPATSTENTANGPVSTEASAAQPAPFAAKKDAAAEPRAITIPAGTPVTVRLQQAVSSATAQPGEEFEAVLDQPLVINGQTVAESGTAVRGRVVAAKSSGRLSNPGYLRLALASMMVNGKSVPVQSSSVYVAGASHKKRNLGWIGGSTAGGALIGGLAGGGKGALIGSAIGAAGGTTAAYTTGKKDVGFGTERRLTFKLTQPVKVG